MKGKGWCKTEAVLDGEHDEAEKAQEYDHEQVQEQEQEESVIFCPFPDSNYAIMKKYEDQK